ncbi:MAG: translation initiation factor IF-2, partial [Candidatus Thorarchaeota archaeon]
KVQGVIKPRTALINEEGRRVGTILQIQDRSVSIDEATDGMEVAVSIRGPTIGRQVKNNEILYVDVPDKQILAIRKKFLDDLSPPEKEVLEELTTIKRAKGHFV